MKKISCIFIFLFLIPSAHAASLSDLVSHRAVYEVKLLKAEERSGITGAEGRIVYETRGNACEGVSVSYRFVTRIQTNRETFITDQQSANFENADGTEFSFSTKSFVNDQPDQNVIGTARRNDDGIKVTHSGENPREISLKKGLFTTSHLLDVLKMAQAGESFTTHTVFDGAGEADTLFQTASVIGKRQQISELFEGEKEPVIELLAEKSSWPVTMSYFNSDADNTAEAMPIYEASFLLYSNGITRDLKMRYPDYTLQATLAELELFDTGECSDKDET
ncbi:MAG: DUF1849 family protein [Pseudomonadota bacterium]